MERRGIHEWPEYGTKGTNARGDGILALVQVGEKAWEYLIRAVDAGAVFSGFKRDTHGRGVKFSSFLRNCYSFLFFISLIQKCTTLHLPSCPHPCNPTPRSSFSCGISLLMACHVSFFILQATSYLGGFILFLTHSFESGGLLGGGEGLWMFFFS